MPVIDIRHINKYYGQGENRVHVLKDVNLTVERGDFVAIIGQSGSGKSTLMNILGCLDTPSDGAYLVDGVHTGELDGNGLARLRGEKFGFIFQRYNLLNSMSAADNVALPAVYAGAPHEERQERAEKLLGELGLADKVDNRPNELSGGQQQRVSIARALMNGGEIILADEPTGALDSKAASTSWTSSCGSTPRDIPLSWSPTTAISRASRVESSKSRTARSSPTPAAEA